MEDPLSEEGGALNGQLGNAEFFFERHLGEGQRDIIKTRWQIFGKEVNPIFSYDRTFDSEELRRETMPAMVKQKFFNSKGRAE